MVGNRTRVKVVKNKMAPPFREVEFDILYGQGISRSGDVLDLGAELGIVEKSGAWFSFGGERIGQGRENAKAYLEQHPEALDKVEAMILAKHGIKRGGAACPRRSRRTARRPAGTPTKRRSERIRGTAPSPRTESIAGCRLTACCRTRRTDPSK